MGASSCNDLRILGRYCRRLRRGGQLPRRRISEMAAGDSMSNALGWPPRFLRPKELRHGTESRCASGSGGYFFAGAFFFFADLAAAFFLLRAGALFFAADVFPAGLPARIRPISPRI